MATVMAKSKTGASFLQAPETSACFQEALRLCRHDSKHESKRRDNVVARYHDNKRNDVENDNVVLDNGDSDRGEGSGNDENLLQPLELKALHPSYPSSALHQPFLPPSLPLKAAAEADEAEGPDGRRSSEDLALTLTTASTGSHKRCVNRSLSVDAVSLQSVEAPPRWGSRRHTISGGNEEEEEEAGPLLPLRVQWADEKDDYALAEAIRESPRRRQHHARKSSTSSCDSLRSILKQP